MLYLKERNKKIILKIVDYEFSHSMDLYDKNWLVINVFIEDPENNLYINKKDPCLLTRELIERQIQIRSATSTFLTKYS
ncbi:WapI family immunity protein [Ignatzschineria sp. LJL83]